MGVLPSSTRSEEYYKKGGKKYFQKDKPDLRIKTTTSED